MLKEAYKPLFLIGFFYLLLGILCWIPTSYFDYYPIEFHRIMITNGFMGHFIAGFLMTAIPQFSKTQMAKPMEITGYFGLSLIFMTVALMRGGETYHFLISVIQSGFILYFILKRFFKRNATPPHVFIFAIIGLLLWFFSSLAALFEFHTISSALIFQALFSFLILGIGSRLIPGLLGHSEIVISQRKAYEDTPFFQTIPKSFLTLIPILLLSFFLPDEVQGNIIRFPIYLFFGLKYWRSHQLPQIRSTMTYSIWISTWFFILSPLTYIFWGDHGIHITHFFFIGSVLLLTLMVSTRVIRAHHGLPVTLENSSFLMISTIGIILASLIRTLAFHFSDYYFELIIISALTLIVSVGVWAKAILFKLIRKV